MDNNSFFDQAKRIIASVAMLGLLMPASVGQTLAYHGHVDKDLVALQQQGPPGGQQGQGTLIISVTVQDSAGTAVQGVFASAHPTDFSYSVGGSSDANGNVDVRDFGSQVKAGNSLVLDVYPPFDKAAGLIAPEPVTLGAWTGTAYAARTVKFKAATKTLTVDAKLVTGEAMSNQKLNFFKDNGGFAQATADSSGRATVKLSGGRWNIMGEPSDSGVWNGPPLQASFKDDESTEALTVTADNFLKVNSTVTGKLKTPDGKALPLGMGLGFERGHEGGIGSPLVFTPGATEASFTAKLPGDQTYKLNIFSPPSLDQNAVQYAADSVEFTIKAGETKDLGTVTLKVKDKKITVNVKNGSVGMMAFAFSPKAHDFGFTQLSASGTDATGTVTVLGGGEYMVMAMGMEFGGPHGGGQHGGQQGTSKLILEGPQPVTPPGTVTFNAIDATSTITGSVTNKSTGAVLKDSFGMLDVSGTTADGKEVATFKPIERGTYSLKVPAMKYLKLRPMMMMGGFMQDDPADEKDLAANQTRTINIGMVPTDATLNVKFVKPDGSAISGIFAHAMATNGSVTVMGDFAGYGGAVAQTNIKVVAAKGPYRILVMSEPGSGFVPIPPKDKVAVSAGETKEVKVTFKPIGAKNGGGTVTGTLTDPDGKPVVGAKIVGNNGLDDDNRDTAKGPIDAFVEFTGVATDKDGKFNFDVAADEAVTVRVAMSPKTLNEKGWILSKEATLTLKSGETKTNDFKISKAEVQVTGKVVDSAGNPVSDAFVSAYTDDGKVSTNTKTNAQGVYTINASAGTKVHLDCTKDVNQTDILTLPGEKLVDTTGKTGTLTAPEMAVEKKTNALVADATKQTAVTNALQIETKDGMSFQSQANAFGTKSEQSATVSVNVTSEGLPSTEGAVPVSNASYDVTASLNGENIASANTPLTMKVPLPETLPAGVDPAKDLKIASYNPDTGEMKFEATQYVPGSDPNKTSDDHLLATFSHLTTFGVVANADTTPAAEVKDPKATAGDTKVTLGWTNPSDSDFNGVEIYRSEDTKSIGSKIKTTAKADTSYEDTGLTNGKAYYYTFKSVDATGNVSPGTNQVVATPSAATAESSSTGTGGTGKTLPKTGVTQATVDAQRSTTNNWFVLAGLVLAGIGVLVLRRRMIR